MEFNCKDDFNDFIKLLNNIGSGAEGTCYRYKDMVCKVFHDYEDNNYKGKYSSEDILKFSKINNHTFIWPTDVIRVDNDVVGYCTNYIDAKNLYMISPLEINLDKFCDCIKDSRKDIKLISDKGISTYDMPYNTLYRNGFYIIDQDDYSFSNKDSEVLYKENTNNFEYELYLFLIDNYFDDVVNDSDNLRKLYSKNDDVLIFIDALRKRLSELCGKEIKTLKDAIKYTDYSDDDYTYQRELALR